MKKIGVAIAILTIVANINAWAQIPPNDPSWGSAIISDNFSGSSINTNIWNVYNDYDHNGEKQCYRTNNVSVSNGKLVLNLKNETYTCTPCTTGNSFQNHSYTSGGVELKRLDQNSDPLYFKYGYIEASVNIPYVADSRLWPAFWTAIGTNLDSTPYSVNLYSSVNEIDIFEELQITNPTPPNEVYQDDKILGAGIFLSYGKDNCGCSPTPCPTPAVIDYVQANLPSSYAGNYHTYAVEWSPKIITWYFDGNAIRRYNNPAKLTYDGDACNYNDGGIHDFTKIIFNLAYQGSAQTIDQSMYIDSVKVYQLQTDCNTNIDATSFDFTSPTYDNKVKGYIKIGGTGGSTTFPANPTISLRADQYVELNEGFSTPSNSTIYIDVPGCPN